MSPGPTDTGILGRTPPAAVLFLGVEATCTTGAELPVDGGTSRL